MTTNICTPSLNPGQPRAAYSADARGNCTAGTGCAADAAPLQLLELPGPGQTDFDPDQNDVGQSHPLVEKARGEISGC